MTSDDMTERDMTERDALIASFRGLDRLGPGDQGFSLNLLRRLPRVHLAKSVADLGCGTGAASLMLAQFFQKPILCVDMAEEFLDDLQVKAKAAGVGNLINAVCADMATLDPKRLRFDLLWSEGAAHTLTFAGAMRKWRSLMLKGGIAVVSDLSWFHTDQHQDALDHWGIAYPDMATELMNQAKAEQCRFKLLFTERLPAELWWSNYYDPVSLRLVAMEASPSEAMQAVAARMRTEMELFRRFSEDYGYTYYVLQAV